MVAASKAFTMNSYSNIVPMLVALDLIGAGHHEHSTLQEHHVDVGPVKPRQDRGRDHFLDRADRGLPVTQIEDAIDRTDERIDLVGAEKHGELEFAIEFGDK